MKRSILMVAATLALSACATTGPMYQAAPKAGAAGYFTAPAENGRQTIVYTGSKGMPRDQVAEYALLRAAEFTTESGHEWFAVIATSTQSVQEGAGLDLQGKGGAFVGSGSVSTSGGAQPQPNDAPGTADSEVKTGPDSGGFGGGSVPYQVLERWTPRSVYRTTLLIQVGSGDDASFEGLTKTPEILSAKATADEIRAKMAKK